VGAKEISDIQFSVILTASDLRAVMNNHNVLLSDIETHKRNSTESKEEITGLRLTLDKELTKEQPNIKEITDRIVK